MNDARPRPPAWTVLEEAMTARRPVRARYHGHDRYLCPHALGWKNGRAKLLAYQTAGTTSTGTLPADARQRWRSMYVDEIEDPAIIDAPWETADNGPHNSNGIDDIIITIG